MLRLNEKVGAGFFVTFVQGRNCLVTQERINGRVGVIAAGEKVSPGDECWVTLLAPSKRQNAMLLRVESVVTPGIGGKSLLQNMLDRIDIAAAASEQNFEVKLIAALKKQMEDQPGTLFREQFLELLLDVLESYALLSRSDCPSLQYGHFCIEVSRLINEHFPDANLFAEERIDYYLRAARYCAARPAGRQWKEAFLAVAMHTGKKNAPAKLPRIEQVTRSLMQ